MSAEKSSLHRALDRVHALREAIVLALGEREFAAARGLLERALQVDDSAAFFEPGYAYDPKYAESLAAQQDFLAQLDPEDGFPAQDDAEGLSLRRAQDVDYAGAIRRAQERVEDLERRREAAELSGEALAGSDELGWYLSSVRGEAAEGPDDSQVGGLAGAIIRAAEHPLVPMAASGAGGSDSQPPAIREMEAEIARGIGPAS